MRVRLSPERRTALGDVLRDLFKSEFDEEISEFRAAQIVDLFVRELGPLAYNQGVRDAATYVQEKLADIEGDVYEPQADG
ncbi:MAG TPA: DUF2164 domain-containing protein [Candidatus Limnocylindrales bacterium]